MSENNQAAASFPLFGIMFLIFMTLKLCGVITWSWWWVTAPLWGGFLFVMALAVFFLVIGLVLARR